MTPPALFPAAAALGPPSAWVDAAADRALLARILSESRVERVPARPAMAEYFQAWAEAVARWVDRFLGRHPGLREGVVLGLWIAAFLILATALALLVLLALRLLRRRTRTEAAAQESLPAAPAAPRPDRAGWRRELERRLSAGDVEGALEALWWWFASSLVSEPDASWTSQQLLREARRTDLGFAAVELDRALYGASRPAAEDVAVLQARLEGALP